MRILMVHNYYRQRGGEDAAFERDVVLLRDRGHEVPTHTVRSDRFDGFADRVRVLRRLAFSKPAYEALRADIRRYQPDVVHVNNFFPVLTPAVHLAARDCGVPTVQSLRNYRLLCAGGLLWRENDGLEPCVRGSVARCVFGGCYRGSRVATLAVARMLSHHRRSQTWGRIVDRFIAPSEFVRDRHVSGGIPAERVAVRTDFAPVTADLNPSGPRTGALFVGRLSAEKGVGTLLAAWRRIPQSQLSVVGTGPLEPQARALAGANVVFHGAEPPEQVTRRMQCARFLVMPSEWYEAEPLVILEALSNGLPVIASRLGAMAEMITHGVDGLLFQPGNVDDLKAQVEWATGNGNELARMGARARSTYERRFSQDVSYSSLMNIYGSLHG